MATQQTSKLLALYDMLRFTVVNVVGGLYNKIASLDKTTFYVRLFVILGTLLMYIFNYLSLSILSTVMFLNTLIKSCKYMTSYQNQYDSNELLSEWVTYGAVILLCKMFNIISKFTFFPLMGLFFEFCKLFLCYKLMSDENMHQYVLNRLLRFYMLNKMGINSLHATGNNSVYYVKNIFSSKND